MRKCRPGPQRQQGFGLLAFVMAASVFGMSLVFGYSGVWTKEHLSLSKHHKAEYMEEVLTQMEEKYRGVSFDMDSTRGDPITNEEILNYLYVPKQWGLTVQKSNLLKSEEGLTYRNYAFYLSITDEDVQEPNLAHFKASGNMYCGASTAACHASYYMVTWSSLDLARQMANDTEKVLERVVKKAQVYFKARQLQDPEKTVSINYFYKPSNVCKVPNSIDLGCLEKYTDVALIEKSLNRDNIVPNEIAHHLALSDADLISGWGLPIQISAVEDAEHVMTPYTLAIRAMRPDGTFIKKTAIQQF